MSQRVKFLVENTFKSFQLYTSGVFDIIHRGHFNILTQSAALGELTVGIMPDRGIEDTKRSRPILGLEERDAQVRSLPFITDVIHYSNTDQRPDDLQYDPQRQLLGYAPVERFFSSLKREWTGDRLYLTRQEAIADVREYVAVYYNSRRLHSTLGYKTPMNHENDLNKVSGNS